MFCLKNQKHKCGKNECKMCFVLRLVEYNVGIDIVLLNKCVSLNQC